MTMLIASSDAPHKAGVAVGSEAPGSVEGGELRILHALLVGPDNEPYVAGSDQVYTPYSVIPTVTAGAYSAGDSIGGTITLDDAVETAGQPVTVQDATITLQTGTPGDCVLFLFVSTPGVIADNAAYAPSMAGSVLAFKQVPIPSSSFSTYNSISKASVSINGIAPLTGTQLFALLVSVAGVTLASTSGMNIRLNTFHKPA